MGVVSLVLQAHTALSSVVILYYFEVLEIIVVHLTPKYLKYYF